MVSIVIRIFPSKNVGGNGRRQSFITHEIIVTAKNKVYMEEVLEAIEASGLLDNVRENYKIARGVSFLKGKEEIESGELLNLIPIG